MDNKSTIHIVIETIICVLLVGVIVVGGILIYKNSNTNINENTSQVTDTKNNEDEKKESNTTVNITNNAEAPKESSSSSGNTIIHHVITPPSSETTNFTVGGQYVADVYSFLSLRSASSTSSTCIVKLAPCTKLIVRGNSTNGMAYVYVNSGIYSGYTGYVYGTYLTRDGYDLTRGAYSAEYYYIYGTKEYLPLRSIPEIDDNYLVGKLYNGDNVMLLEKTNSRFWKVRDMENKKDGYVVCDYLRR